MKFQFHDYQPEYENLHQAVTTGLAENPKNLHPKFFYDAIGSQLFDRICEQPEYYIPRVEQSIFDYYADEIIASMGEHCHIIEPGAGSSVKIRFFLDRMQPAMYVPMDISAEHLRTSAENLSREYPHLPIHAICVDHTSAYDLPKEIPEKNRVFFYPGSSLSNFDPDDAVEFLRDIYNKAGDDGKLIIGIDTKKPKKILNDAYNDVEGKTADFNLNVLNRIKQELNAEINVDNFYHHAFYNEQKGRIEMHLHSQVAQQIVVDEHCFEFIENESIHTESSYKYTLEEFQDLALEAGWKSNKVWQDKQQHFSVHFLTTTKK